MADITKDTLVDGRYEVQSRLGSGGMADVYCAHDTQLGRRVALKVLHRRFAEDEQFVERFRREASSAAGLQHPNVVGVYDRGEWDGTYYIAMEYLGGRTLKQIIVEEGPLDPALAIDIAIQLLKAARFAHKRGIIHRDLKPHNVIVDEEGRAKVTDFGIARAGASDVTDTGTIMGTAQYLSPEQAQGHAVSAQSDLYSAGVVLYEMLTGRVPFEAETAVTIALKHVSEVPAPPSAHNPAVTPFLEGVVMHALEKDPRRRFPDADAFIAALEEARATLDRPEGQRTTAWTVVDEPATDATRVAAVPYPMPDAPLVPRERRNRGGLLAVLLLLLLAGAALAAYVLTRPELAPVPAVVGEREATAVAVLRRAGFRADVERVENASVPRGRVATQDPQPRVRAERGSTVAIIVSAGPGTAVVPPVAGKGRRTAERLVARAGFEVRIEEEASDTVRAGRVIRSVPSEGSTVERDQTVTLVVSTGREEVQVPALVGKTQEEAERILDRLELRVEVSEREDETADPGTVLEQTPEPTTTVREGSQVTIVVAEETATVAVPDTVGQDVEDASAALQDADLGVRLRRRTVDTLDQDGIVLEQDPEGGRLERGRRVTLVVGQFEPPDLDPEGTEPDPTETTPTTPAPDPGAPAQ